MAYGISIKKSNGQPLADPTMLGGRLFVQRIRQTVGTSNTYTFTGVPSGDDLIVYTVQAGFHTIVKGTDSGSATLTLTAITRNPLSVAVDTELLIFTTKTKEPDYGCSVVNQSGQKLVSTVYPCPYYLISGTPVLIGSYPLESNSPYSYRHDYSISLGNASINSTRIILWALPDDTSNDVWYNATSCLSSGTSNIIGMSILNNSLTAPSSPTGYIFQMDNIDPGSQNYGMRIYDSSQRVTFDSGLNHLIISGLTEGLYFSTPTIGWSTTSTPMIVNSFNIPEYAGISNPLCYLPVYYQESAFPDPGGAVLSKQFFLQGWVKREGIAMKLATIGQWNIEDAIISYSYVLGGYNQITLTASLSDYV